MWWWWWWWSEKNICVREEKQLMEQAKLCTASVKACTTNNDDLNGVELRAQAVYMCTVIYSKHIL